MKEVNPFKYFFVSYYMKTINEYSLESFTLTSSNLIQFDNLKTWTFLNQNSSDSDPETFYQWPGADRIVNGPADRARRGVNDSDRVHPDARIYIRRFPLTPTLCCYQDVINPLGCALSPPNLLPHFYCLLPPASAPSSSPMVSPMVLRIELRKWLPLFTRHT